MTREEVEQLVELMNALNPDERQAVIYAATVMHQCRYPITH